MSEQKFCASLGKDAEWKEGARGFFEYRDLGIKDATNGAFNAHVIRLKDPSSHGLRGTGQHVHELDFQMFYVLKGWIKFTYEGRGEVTFQAGDSCLQPPGIVHDEIECSDDIEVIEITSPANFKTTSV
jgi:mannose-6-phosphate isomerase-like protein (cupin superfamily)